MSECFPFDELRGDKVMAIRFADLMNSQDVRVIQGGGSTRFLLEATHAVMVPRQVNRQKFQRDLSAQTRVFRQVDVSHSSRTQQNLNLVRPKFSPNQ